MAKHIQSNGIPTQDFADKLEALEGKVEMIERKISTKADEIVSLQILEHRRELEEIYEVIKNIDLHMQHIENELTQVEEFHNTMKNNETTSQRQSKKTKKSSKKVTPLFS